MSIPLHVLTTHHSLKDVRVVIAEFDKFQQVDGVITSNPNIAISFVLLAQLELLILYLDAHARDVVVVADVVLALLPGSTMPLQEPRMVKLMMCFEYPV